jgi:hypothetical protein
VQECATFPDIICTEFNLAWLAPAMAPAAFGRLGEPRAARLSIQQSTRAACPFFPADPRTNLARMEPLIWYVLAGLARTLLVSFGGTKQPIRGVAPFEYPQQSAQRKTTKNKSHSPELRDALMHPFGIDQPPTIELGS